MMNRGIEIAAGNAYKGQGFHYSCRKNDDITCGDCGRLVTFRENARGDFYCDKHKCYVPFDDHACSCIEPINKSRQETEKK